MQQEMNKPYEKREQSFYDVKTILVKCCSLFLNAPEIILHTSGLHISVFFPRKEKAMPVGKLLTDQPENYFRKRNRPNRTFTFGRGNSRGTMGLQSLHSLMYINDSL